MHLTRSLSLVAALSILATPAAAADIGTDLTTGGGFGSTAFSSGLTVKRYLGENKAVQAFLGTGWGFGVSADLVVEKPITDIPNVGKVFWGVGGGGGLYSWGYGSTVGVSGVVELGLHFTDFPVEITTDIRPTYWVDGGGYVDYYGSAFQIGGGGAVRYYFK